MHDEETYEEEFEDESDYAAETFAEQAIEKQKEQVVSVKEVGKMEGANPQYNDTDVKLLDWAEQLSTRSTCSDRTGCCVMKDGIEVAYGFGEGKKFVNANKNPLITVHAIETAMLSCEPEDRNMSTIYIDGDAVDSISIEMQRFIMICGVNRVVYRDSHGEVHVLSWQQMTMNLDGEGIVKNA